MTNWKSWAPPPKQFKSAPYTVDAAGAQKVPGETIPRRSVPAKDGLKTTFLPEIKTVYDILQYSAKTFGNAKAVGYRKTVQLHNETKKITKIVDGQEQQVDKKWSYFELGPYQYLSFIEFERLAKQAGAGYRKLGLNKGDKVEIYGATSPWWFATAHGASSQSMPIVTAYDTLGEEGLQISLVQNSVKAIYCDPHLLPKLVKPLETAKTVTVVVYNSQADVKQADIDALKKAHDRLTVLSFDELQQLGKDNPVEPVAPEPSDLCCVMYTSGGMGTPKGVLLKHSNVVAAGTGIDTIVGKYLGPGDGFLAYLPLAHIFEFVVENTVLFWGGTLGYGNAKTLSDINVRNCKGDIREFQPTVLVGVPAVWEQVKKGIIAKVNGGSPIVQKMFWGALHAKSVLLNTGLPGSTVLDHVVFNKVKDATGGKMRFCLNGGGPISKETQRFISMAICPLLSGYGLTETSAMGAICDPAAWTDEALGEIPGSIEIKLVDVPDLGYVTDRKQPQGEIWIRGGSVASGYLELEQETKEAFTDDGWFKTGDIGEFDSKGYIKIIDRKKNLVKTLNGEYIALEKLESIYRSCTVVANICVYADPDRAKPLAIVVPAEPALKKLAQSNGVQGETIETLVHSKKLSDVVLAEMQKTGRAGGLNGIEIIEAVVLVDEEWNPENGLTTSAQKLSRKKILERYRKQIDDAYKNAS